MTSPTPPWTRAFLALGTLILVSSTFTLAKTIRDRQETDGVLGRLDRARVERLLAGYDPFRPPDVFSSSADAASAADHPSPTSLSLSHQPVGPTPFG